MSTITVNSIITPGKEYQYVHTDDPIRGGMKDVYFSPDRSYVVAFYRSRQDYNSRERLKRIVTQYYNNFFNDADGTYFKGLFCWPTDMVESKGLVGIIVPCYRKNFFFTKGYETNDLIKGKEKEGKWFASPKFRNKDYPLRLAGSELGNWMNYLQICINIARGVKRLHASGLAHSDLSYKNVLIDPVTGAATIIDIDGLVVPGLFPPEVIGTADFIAPEVLATKHLKAGDPNRKLPDRITDLHALSVMIYMYLLCRHPLKGGKIHAMDAETDDLLAMGSKALFIEHETDRSNRPKFTQINSKELPWADTRKLPYTITGPYLSALFKRALVDGLHNPAQRPTADEWVNALIKTTDLLQPCANPACAQKWYVFDNTTKPTCPFCHTPYRGKLPVLDLFYQAQAGKWRSENHRLMVYHKQYLFEWHINRDVVRGPQLSEAQRKPVGYFSIHNGKWVLVNQRIPKLHDVTNNRDVPLGTMVELNDKLQLVFSGEMNGRAIVVTMVN